MVSRTSSVVAEKIKEFLSEDLPQVFERSLSLGKVQEPLRGNIVNTVVGIRRCGKTYRLYQEMHRILQEGHSRSFILYFNFEDERLKPYDSGLLSEVIDTYFALNPEAKQKGCFLFFDEIQEVPDWGLFLRRVVDTEKATVYVTGSSSKMLSLNTTTEYRGRSLSRELFPMSFAEFIRFDQNDSMVPDEVNYPRKAFTSAERAYLRNAISRYLMRGGFIAAQQLEASDAISLLQDYAYRTVNYDVIERYGISNPAMASRFLGRCLASSAREISLNKIHGEFRSQGIKVSRETLSQLLGYYEEAYLLFTVKDFSRALSSNTRSTSKVYAVDPGMLVAFSPSASQDSGQRLETAVFNKLRQSSLLVREGAISRATIRKSSTAHEIDFVVGDALLQEAYKLIQVSYSLEDKKTRMRETAALDAGMAKYRVNESWIITFDEEEELITDEGTIHIVPAWKWLLEE